MVHGALTGPEARRRNLVDEDKLQAAWEILDKAWHDIDQVRSLGVSGGLIGPEEVERYIASWQIFMFECSKFHMSLASIQDSDFLITQTTSSAKHSSNASPVQAIALVPLNMRPMGCLVLVMTIIRC